MSSLSDLFGEASVNMVMKATGVERVQIADEEQTASDMCYEAARFLLEKEEINKEEIDGLVFVSQTADYRAPATSIILQDKLGLQKKQCALIFHRDVQVISMVSFRHHPS